MTRSRDMFSPLNQPIPELVAELEAEIARLERVARRQSTVLVVDDMQTMRLLLAQALKSAGFKDILRASDGESGWNMLQSQDCDLALVDWNMPRMDGLALLDRVRFDPKQKDLIFILVTAEHLDLKVMQAAEESQDAYLTKPVSAEKLIRRLEVILERRLTLARALKLEALGQVDKAVDEFMAAAANRPRLRWPFFGLGGLLFRQERWEEAERCYRRVLELDPEALGALVELGRIKEAQGLLEEGRGFFQEALTQNPRFFRAYDALSLSLSAQGRGQEALQVLEEAMAEQGSENALRQEILGQLRYDQRHYAGAAAALSKALALKPRHHASDNNLLLARSRLAQGHWDEALPALREAAKAGQAEDNLQNRLDAMLLLGATHLRAGQEEQAEKVWDELEDPRFWPEGQAPFGPAQWQMELGGIYLATGHEEQAVERFLASLELAPGDAAHQEALAELCLGLGCPQVLERALAAQAQERRDLVEVHSRRGLELVAAGRYDEAEAEYQKGLALEADSGRLRFNLGKLQYRLGRQEEALRTLVLAARLGLQQKDWDLVGETARLFASLGRSGEAKALVNQCLSLDPGNRYLAQVLEGL
ncbi:MAG: tetratricopeptide repeat protein [Pseudomonadota bacterium]